MAEPFQIGKSYLVPCVRSCIDARRWLPVLPFKHNDPQFGTKAASYEHYHYDLRFWSDALIRVEFHSLDFEDIVRKRTNRIRVQLPSEGELKVRIIPRKCHRRVTGLNNNILDESRLPKKTIDWYARQIGKSCQGKICPHFKQPMTEHDGILECPYHGLVGDPKTQKIIGNVLTGYRFPQTFAQEEI